MARILTFEIAEDEYAAIQAMLQDVTDEMRRSRETMQKDQAEINRLTEEIEQIKIATKESKAESDRVLAELEARHSIFF